MEDRESLKEMDIDHEQHQYHKRKGRFRSAKGWGKKMVKELMKI